jgi:hypothetical protein
VVLDVPIARQRIAKYMPAEGYSEKIGRPFLGNGAVNTPKNCWDTVFSVWPAPGIYKAEFQVSNES